MTAAVVAPAGMETHLAWLEARVQVAVDHRRAVDLDPTDGFKGLYVSDDHVDQMLAHGRSPSLPDDAPMPPHESWEPRARRLMEAFRLDCVDLELLVVALAPDIDQRFERLYGYLHDDVSRRRASPGLALELCGLAPTDPAARSRLAEAGTLLREHLIELEDPERPYLTRALRVPDRVTAFLLGDDTAPVGLVDADGSAAPITTQDVDRISRALDAGVEAVYLRQLTDHGAVEIACRALNSLGRDALLVSLDWTASEDREALIQAAVREAGLRRAGVVVGPIDDSSQGALQHLARCRQPVVLFGPDRWDPITSQLRPLQLELQRLPSGVQEAIWEDAGGGVDVTPPSYRLGPGQIRRALAAGQAHAAADGAELSPTHLIRGAREQNSAGLERLARRIEPSADWTDIVLPRDTLQTLQHLTARVANRHRVLDEWKFRRGGGRGEGIAGLFAGDSGTGKTLAAEVIAGDLGLDLYVIDLSTVVDKYIGETEKNLERIFTEAEGVNGVLFFDEADALFGKRSEVSDARDRYANVEIAYLLQRIETFDGLAILATNLKANIDEAFARRLSVIVDFPEPGQDERRVLWDLLLGEVPRAADVDLDFCARSFDLSGGDIRNIAVTAAYEAAGNGGVVHMDDLVRATAFEYRKLGRLCLDSEFGPYGDVVAAGLTSGSLEEGAFNGT